MTSIIRDTLSFPALTRISEAISRQTRGPIFRHHDHSEKPASDTTSPPVRPTRDTPERVSPPRNVKVLSVTSELFPLVKTGGLADVAGALPKALQAHGAATATLLPAYPGVMERLGSVEHLGQLELLGEEAALLRGYHHDLQIFLLDCPSLFHRDGGLYVDRAGLDYPDNWKRFAALSLAAAKIAAGFVENWVPDIVHTHDWQTALTPAYMQDLGVRTPTILTIHNLAFQGQFPAQVFPQLALSPRHFSSDCMEYYGDVSFLKAGIALSNSITTVSPTYAREILTPDLGMGMDGFLAIRRDDIRGIVNGIDQELWDPSTDDLIPSNYDVETIDRRRDNRAAIEQRFGIGQDDGAILSVVSRLTWQKGIDLLAPIVPGIVDRGAKLIVYGQGDPMMIEALAEQARRYPGRVVLNVDFNEKDAHLLHGGSDIVLQPSRFEPCGLTQLYALRYGAIPIVARTGGLAETIIDANEAAMEAKVATGFQFQPGSVEDLYHAVDRALVAFDHPAFWRQLQVQAMKANFSWHRSARQYAALYKSLVSARMHQDG